MIVTRHRKEIERRILFTQDFACAPSTEAESWPSVAKMMDWWLSPPPNARDASPARAATRRYYAAVGLHRVHPVRVDEPEEEEATREEDLPEDRRHVERVVAADEHAHDEAVQRGAEVACGASGAQLVSGEGRVAVETVRGW